ncbi:nucleolar protein 8 isoform X2 [Gouania willdenowi]|uniref:nucleolar protein 8 isoform X2 n=1 Tax=Gouania willdenowi TaxID=441366 RepID=UPI00105511CC|nr:nucleolar protein 8 isoform X2 [Gouania willdenowi]
MRRLYVGGLSHTVTQKDLKDRFGKFGAVEDVELRTRKDEEGVPYKTFGYINIDISDADLKKCLTVLNKSKWKGGTLQIEAAKDSFLDRLAQERQDAATQRLLQPAADDKSHKLLDSLDKAGVKNFTMKAAVPGTEVPGHEDWVVSKFGRVLPILQLRGQKGGKSRTLKYDPSKYCHNIRRLDQKTSDEATPITQLTWEVQGGDDDISKKRRGEFPHYKPPKPKKSRTDVVNSHKAAGGASLKPSVTPADQSESVQLTNRSQNGVGLRPAQERRTRFADSDSEEEIRRLVTAQQTSHDALRQGQEEEGGTLEVVGLDYMTKFGQKGGKEEEDYDSADTDEILASRNPPPQLTPTPPSKEKPAVNDTVRNRKTRTEEMKTGKQKVEEETDVTFRKVLSTQDKEDARKPKPSRKIVVETSYAESGSDEDKDHDSADSESSDSDSSDSDYDAMFSNVTHLEISMADLQKLAEVAQQSETTDDDITAAKNQSDPPEPRSAKKGITPEEILASIMGDNSSDDDGPRKKKRKKKCSKKSQLPAFQGTKVMKEMEKQEDEDGFCKDLNSKETKFKHKVTEDQENQGKTEERASEKMKTVASPQALKTVPSVKTTEHEEDSSSATDEDDQPVSVSTPLSSTSSEEDETEDIVHPPALHRDDEEQRVVTEHPLPRAALAPKEEEERQRKANVRRLAAVQQRQKEAEEHKRLIQGALANLDAPAAGAGKHIVFGSDDDDDEEDDEKEQLTVSEPTPLTKTLFQGSQSEDEETDEAAAKNTKKEKLLKSSGRLLFDGSEDEEDGDEDDGDMFDIKPQFEGRAGQKLMELQSRFGTDERFRMDSRFLEEDGDKDETSETKPSRAEDDEALEEERKKNLSILQSVLGSSEQTCSSKTTSKAKKFRDVSALHYDPSREEHAAFETKTEDVKKESKSARRKKREEAQKLPEVSKEIYYDVSGDLKDVFGQTTKDVAEEEEKINWDQVDEEEPKQEETTTLSSVVSDRPTEEEEESSGFKFSFFGDDAEMEITETAEYKVESIKVSWQQDPRFHDSSSEEEDEDDADEQEEDEEQSSATCSATTSATNAESKQETTSKVDFFFFFHANDSRLTDGPRLFRRVSELEEQREQWEERRSSLRLEYRKKHKDAKRRLVSSLRS